jgi:hypothetical protein
MLDMLLKLKRVANFGLEIVNLEEKTREKALYEFSLSFLQ